MADNNCVLCQHSLRGRRRHVLNERLLQSRRDFVEHILNAVVPPREVELNGTRCICHSCWHTVNARLNQPEPVAVAANNNCVSCGHSLRNRHLTHVLNESLVRSRRDIVEAILNTVEPPHEIPFDGSRSICHACWYRINANINQNQAAVGVPVPPRITRAANTSRRCMFDGCNRLQLCRVSNAIKIQLLSYYSLYIPNLARICEHHLRTTSFEDFSDNINNRQTDIDSEGLLDIVTLYTEALENKSVLNFENMTEITEPDLHFWTGLNHRQFNDLIGQIPSLQQQSSTPQLDLGIYLSKLRTGEPSLRLGTVFNMSRQSVDRKVQLVRKCLLNDFVPLHLGLEHITRSEAITRNRVLPQHIFGNADAPNLIAIFDGTYLFVEKSANFPFQRRSYSVHKYKNLIKPFMIVCSDGHILDITGPYDARTTDADIMQRILNNHGEPIEDNAFHYFFEQDDTFILDRGFRDAIPEIESHGYNAHMPPTKRRNETQLSTEDANKSRLITMCRWVVEAINGRFKRDFKMFRHRIFNRAMPHVFEDYKIAGALINCYQEPYEDSPYTNEFMGTINQNMHKPNLVADYIQEHNINRQRVSFERLDAENPQLSDFPRLSLEDLIRFSVGTYHVKLARSYCSEHLRGTDVFEIERYRHSEQVFGDPNDVLIRCVMNSRHRRRITYYTYVLYNTALQGRNSIKEHYCSCLHGRRTLGSCTHIVSILYYLGWARHEEIFSHPAAFLDSVLIDNN